MNAYIQSKIAEDFRAGQAGLGTMPAVSNPLLLTHHDFLAPDLDQRVIAVHRIYNRGTMVRLYRDMATISGTQDLPLTHAGETLAAIMDAEAGRVQGNAYHNMPHFHEVPVNGNIIMQAQELYGDKLSREEKATVDFMTLIHDKGHPGGTNGKTPFKFEDATYREIEPILDMYGIDARTKKRIHYMLRYTDVFSRAKLADDPAMLTGDPVFDARTKKLAQIVGYADILGSVGLTPDKAIQQGEALAQEFRDRQLDASPVTCPKGHQGFLKCVLGSEGQFERNGAIVFNRFVRRNTPIVTNYWDQKNSMIAAEHPADASAQPRICPSP